MLAEWIDIVNLKNKFASEKRMYEENHYCVFDMGDSPGPAPYCGHRRTAYGQTADPHGTWLSSHLRPTSLRRCTSESLIALHIPRTESVSNLNLKFCQLWRFNRVFIRKFGIYFRANALARSLPDFLPINDFVTKFPSV